MYCSFMQMKDGKFELLVDSAIFVNTKLFGVKLLLPMVTRYCNVIKELCDDVNYFVIWTHDCKPSLLQQCCELVQKDSSSHKYGVELEKSGEHAFVFDIDKLSNKTFITHIAEFFTHVL